VWNKFERRKSARGLLDGPGAGKPSAAGDGDDRTGFVFPRRNRVTHRLVNDDGGRVAADGRLASMKRGSMMGGAFSLNFFGSRGMDCQCGDVSGRGAPSVEGRAVQTGPPIGPVARAVDEQLPRILASG